MICTGCDVISASSERASRKGCMLVKRQGWSRRQLHVSVRWNADAMKAMIMYETKTMQRMDTTDGTYCHFRLMQQRNLEHRQNTTKLFQQFLDDELCMALLEHTGVIFLDEGLTGFAIYGEWYLRRSDARSRSCTSSSPTRCTVKGLPNI